MSEAAANALEEVIEVDNGMLAMAQVYVAMEQGREITGAVLQQRLKERSEEVLARVSGLRDFLGYVHVWTFFSQKSTILSINLNF